MPKTHKHIVNEILGQDKDKSNSIRKLSTELKIPYRNLLEVYKRGVGAWKTNISSVRLKKDYSKNPSKKFGRSARLTKEQWGKARVYAFISKIKRGKKLDHDTDLYSP